MELFKTTPKINFLAQTWIAVAVSLIMLAGSVYIWIKRGNDKYGIDFRGGYAVTVKINEPTNSQVIERALTAHDLRDVAVQSFEATSGEYMVRVALSEGVDIKWIQEKVQRTLKDLFDDRFEIVATDSIGATIGAEVKRKALWAISFGLAAVLIYLAFRFPFSFGLGAVVAMFHDVIIATGMYLWAGRDLNGAALAAALTIIGYSVNDTIVIFDRVREFMLKRKNYNLAELMNESMNSCLSRTIITSGLTWLAALALLIFGGGALRDLMIYLVAGIIVGCYSTIYIACPVVLWWEGRWSELKAVGQGRKAAV